MSIQPIRLFGDPVLTTPASPVEVFDKELRKLVKDLTDTMRDAPGAGLAAPQIGVSLRVFVWDVDDELGHLINPSLSLSEEMQDGQEGCLSFPDVYYDTPRALRVVARGMNMHGDLFIDRMPGDSRKSAMKEIRESEWFGSAIAHGREPVIKVSPHSTRGLGI